MTLLLAVLLLWQGYLFSNRLPDLQLRARGQDKVVEHLRQVDGPVVATDSFLACAAGKTAFANQFMVAQLARRGKCDQRAYIQALERGSVKALLLKFDLHGGKTRRQVFTQPMLSAMRQRYVLKARHGRYRIYEPKAKP